MSATASSATPTVSCQSDECINGNPPSRLECPTCNKLGIKNSFFCEQACFKKSWKSHKKIHDLLKAQQPLLNDPSISNNGTFNPFFNFAFTGPLRPVYPLSPKREVPAHIPRPDYAETGNPESERKASNTVRLLNQEEQESMRYVCKISREVLDIAASALRPGITTDEIDAIVHQACIDRDAYPSPLNYKGFPKSVCTSVNEVICHGIPDQRKLLEGDIVNLDVSLYYKGYHGDLNATYPVGTISDEDQKLIRTTRECLDEAIKLCKPGALFRDLGKTMEPIARANGCSVVRTYYGHGIHELFHTIPNIPHFAKNKAVGTMKPGMVFTIEPMINMGSSWEDTHWPDGWTAVTVSGKKSAQFEETLLITETGVEVLTAGSDAKRVYP